MEKFLKIEIIKAEPTDFKGTSTKSGTPRDFHIRYQDGVAFVGGPYPVPVRVNLEPGQTAYPVGQYVLLPESFELVNGDFRLKRIWSLQQIAQPKQQ